MWDPDVYLAFADHRSRPFYDMLSRVGAQRARRVVDLGCGAGNLTKYLEKRWPGSVIEALDTSPEMVAAARERGIDATVGDVRDWAPKPDTDVVVSNAAFALGARTRRSAAAVGGPIDARGVDRGADPGQLRDTIACRGAGRGAPRTLCKGIERHTISSRCGSAAAGKLRQSAVGRRMPSRRVGDDVPAPADRRTPRCWIGSPVPRWSRCANSSTTRDGKSFDRSLSRCWTTPTRRGPTVRRSFRSAGCSSSPKSVERTAQPNSPGLCLLLDAAVYGDPPSGWSAWCGESANTFRCSASRCGCRRSRTESRHPSAGANRAGGQQVRQRWCPCPRRRRRAGCGSRWDLPVGRRVRAPDVAS